MKADSHSLVRASTHLFIVALLVLGMIALMPSAQATDATGLETTGTTETPRSEIPVGEVKAQASAGGDSLVVEAPVNESAMVSSVVLELPTAQRLALDLDGEDNALMVNGQQDPASTGADLTVELTQDKKITITPAEPIIVHAADTLALQLSLYPDVAAGLLFEEEVVTMTVEGEPVADGAESAAVHTPQVAGEEGGEDPALELQPRSLARAAASLETQAATINAQTGLVEPVPNPQLVQRCGQSVALVFDLSNSIGDSGLSSLKNTGRAIVDALNGTSVSMSLFNFATDAPRVASAQQVQPLSLLDKGSATQLKDKIEAMNVTAGVGGTNWEKAIESVSSAGTHFDVVYFITDGMPTTSTNLTSMDAGSYTHADDINSAISAANDLKNAGTRLEVVAIKMPNIDVNVLKDSVRVTKPRRPADGTLAVDSHNSEGGHYNPTSVVKWSQRAGRWVPAATSEWLYTVTNADTMLNYLAGPPEENPTAARYTNLSEFNQLTDTLKKKLVGPCQSKLTIHKTIVDESGAKISEGTGWQFTATVTPGRIVGEYDSNGNPVAGSLVSSDTATTDDKGAAEFGIYAGDDSAPGGGRDATVTVKELLEPGSSYRIFQQGTNQDQVAVCTFVGTDAQQAVTYSNVGDDGFQIVMPWDSGQQAVRSVTCEVHNFQVKNPWLKIAKVAYGSNGPMQQPLDGAQFALYRDADGQPDLDHGAMLTLDGNADPQQLGVVPGDYWLMETVAPAGYELLAAPVKVNFAYDLTNKWTVTVADGGTLISSDNVTDQDGKTITVIKVADVHTGTLPRTGGRGVWVFALAGMAIVAGGVVIGRRRA